jgi:hypothetical protein
MIMAFCANCGTKMDDGVKFCPSCGTAAGGVPPAAPKPATEKVGNIRKCPACGAEVESFQTRCASCGHEFANVGASGNIKAFFDKIMELESAPAGQGSAPKKNIGRILLLAGIAVTFFVLAIIGYADGGMSDLIGASVVGILVFVSVLLIMMFTQSVKLNETELKKKTMIENFPIPNTREDLLEFLILASSKIVPAHGFTYSARLGQAWNKIWAVKCRQVYAKSDLTFAGDQTALTTVKDIRERTELPFRQARKRMIIAAIVPVIALLYGVFTLINNATGFTVKVPESAAIAPEMVSLSGAFSEQLKVTGQGVTMRLIENGAKIQMNIELESDTDLSAVLDQEVQKFIKAKNWNPVNCTYEISFSELFMNKKAEGILSHAHTTPNGEDADMFIASLLKLKPGAASKVLVFVAERDKDLWTKKPDTSDGEWKRQQAAIMSMKEIDLQLNAKFEVRDQTKEYKDREYLTLQ